MGPLGSPRGARARIRHAMTVAWLPMLVPMLVMLFALAMEHLEAWMDSSPVRTDELDDLLGRARTERAPALLQSEPGGALALFRLRHRARP
jgi:hypothetical protein